MSTNPLLKDNPGLLAEDPCGKGWICRIRPSSWKSETQSYFLAEEASNWSKKEVERFKDFLAESVSRHTPGQDLTVLQDGGELKAHLLPELSEEIWNDFQNEFLNP